MEENIDIGKIQTIGFIVLCLILSCGIPGNIVSIIVWMKGENCCKSPSAVFFKLLAVCDLAVLVIPGTDYFMYLFPLNRVDLRQTSDLLCKFLTSSTFLTLEMSLGVTMALTIERAITVCLPLRTYHSNVKKRAYAIFIVIILVSILLSTPHFVFESVTEFNVAQPNTTASNTSNKVCTYSREAEYIKLIRVFHTIQFSCHVLIPVITITVCNCIILKKLCSGENQDIHTDCETIKKTIHSVTLLIACISIIHVVSTLPLALQVISYYHDFQLTPFWATFSQLVIQTLLFLNSGINCVLYCFIGNGFREDCRKLSSKWLTCCKH